MTIMTSHTPAAVQKMPHGLATCELSAIEKDAQAIDGDWTVIAFDCECCGRTTAAVIPTCEAVAGPAFEITRDDDDKVLLTTTWLDGEDYLAEFWSLPEALNTMRATISRAAEASRGTEAKAKTEA